jgi:hypothetical protein
MTDTDVRDLLNVFERCQPAADDDIFYADVLTGLRELIPCDDISFQLMDVAEQRLRLLYVSDDGVHRKESVGIPRPRRGRAPLVRPRGERGAPRHNHVAPASQYGRLCPMRRWLRTPRFGL